MAFLVDETPSFSRFQEDFVFESRPMMLKDFLRDDGLQYSSTSSSLSCKSTFVNKPHIVLLRSWSTKKISAVHKVIKLLHFTSLKSPSLLHRGISRKSSKRSRDKNDISGEVKVKVKDILRWRSFRDVVEDHSTPLDFPLSPHRSTVTARRSTEELPQCGGENEEFWGKKCLLGHTPGTNATTLKNPKAADWSIEECEQQSPVSVLDSPFREIDEDFISRFHPTLTNVQKTKCKIPRTIHQKVSLERVDAAGEKAKQLMRHLKEDSKNQAYDNVIMDFFMHELSINGKLHDCEFDCKILRIAKSWMDGEYDDEWYDWEVEDKRESYVKDIENGVCWNKSGQEQENVSKELDVMVLDDLIDDLLADFLSLNDVGSM